MANQIFTKSNETLFKQLQLVQLLIISTGVGLEIKAALGIVHSSRLCMNT